MVEVFAQGLSQPVRENMRPRHRLVTASPLDFVSTLMFRMLKANVGAAIVVEKNRPVGILTEKDVLGRVVMREQNIYTTTAGEVMTKPLISIESDRPIKEALELMRKHNVRRLPVTEDGILVGLITERRLLAAIARWAY